MPMLKLIVLGAIALPTCLMSILTANSPVYSTLWGQNGELWKPEMTLPDFSYAGYHANEADTPNAPAQRDLKRDFHAAGDAKTDDSAALENAARQGGVIAIPEGKYRISRPIQITNGNFVLRGAGPGKTVLYFPESLTDLKGNHPDPSGQSEWSFGPGLIDISGQDPVDGSTRIASVAAPAHRGERQLVLSGLPSIHPGEWVRLVESDPPKSSPQTGTLIRHLYAGSSDDAEDLFGEPAIVRFPSRVARINGNRIELERPLPYDVNPAWTPEIHRFAPTVEEVGIENLSIEFPWTPYPGHFREKGYNALTLSRVSQCWIRNLEIENADFGLSLEDTNFCTVQSLRLTVSANRAQTPEAKGASGHHGIDIGHGAENLVTGFDIETKFVHDISLEWFALHTVYAKGRGLDLAMDHHREANYSNLFTDLDCGKGSRPFYSGGSRGRGTHSGAYNTYWNIRAQEPMSLPPAGFGPLLNFIGFETRAKQAPDDSHWFFEPVKPADLSPPDLAAAMRKRRLRASSSYE
jgi:hypothetical protein